MLQHAGAAALACNDTNMFILGKKKTHKISDTDVTNG